MKEKDSRINNEIEEKQNQDLILEEQPASTEEPKEKQQRSGRKRKKKERLRLIPIWLRILIAIVLVGGSLILGLIVGFAILGDGEPRAALDPSTWYHLIDIIRGR